LGLPATLRVATSLAPAMRAAGVRDELNALEHEKRGKRQLRPARTQQISAPGGEQVRQAIAGAAFGHALRSSFRAFIAHDAGFVAGPRRGGTLNEPEDASSRARRSRATSL
jgi:hypothetical protein